MSGLSDNERRALAAEIVAQLKHELYLNAGKGLVHAALKYVGLGLLLLAAYGYGKGHLL